MKKGKRREKDDCSLRHDVIQLLIVGSTALASGEMRWRTVVLSTETEDTIATMTRHLVLRLYDGEVAQTHKQEKERAHMMYYTVRESCLM